MIKLNDLDGNAVLLGDVLVLETLNDTKGTGVLFQFGSGLEFSRVGTDIDKAFEQLNPAEFVRVLVESKKDVRYIHRSLVKGVVPREDNEPGCVLLMQYPTGATAKLLSISPSADLLDQIQA